MFRSLRQKAPILEAAFVDAQHVAAVCGIDLVRAQQLIEQVATEQHNTIVTRFNDKRTALHKQYGNRGHPLARTVEIRSNAVPLPSDQRVGKDMIRWIEVALRLENLLRANETILRASPTLGSQRLAQILANV